MSNAFRFNAKNAFITYAQCPLDKAVVQEKLLNAFPDTNYLLIGQEKHSDGGLHLHVFQSFNERFHCRSPRAWDLEGGDGVIYHPNVQAPRRCRDTLKYVRKEDKTPLEWGTWGATGWSEIIEAGTRDSFMETVRKLYPRDYVLSYDKLCSYADSHYSTDRTPFETPYTADDFTIPADLQAWFDHEFIVSHNCHATLTRPSEKTGQKHSY